MIKKYNLALIPLSKTHEIITLSQKLSHLADKYLLGEKSFPHITLGKFHAEEQEIKQIWQRICHQWHEKPLRLTFNTFHHVTFNEDVFWISLLPNNSDILYKMHDRIKQNVQITTKRPFDPHMTLINTKNKTCENEITKLSTSYKPIADNFILSLGVSDAVGQLTKILYRC